MQITTSQVKGTGAKNTKRALLFAFVFAVFAILRDSIILWAFSFGYYRDSNLYVSLGQTLFQKPSPFSSGIVTFPYPFLNAVTVSSSNPVRLIWLQIIIGGFAVGLLTYVIAKKHLALALLVGFLLVFDFIWGATNRNIMKEGLFVSFNVLSLAILVNHYDRRYAIPGWELILVGIFYGWTFIFRPSSLYLAILIPPFYLWLTRSWRKTAFLLSGFLIIYLALGLFNLWSVGKFKIFGQSGYYTGSPLFVYRLFTPSNGPASQELGNMLDSCMPNFDYTNAMDTSAGGVKNNELLYGKFIPCLQSFGLSLEETSDLMTKAYIEGIIRNPVYFAEIVFREGITFLKYTTPNILRFYLKPELNNRCEDYAWCEHVRDSRYSWGAKIPFARLYEKVAAKVFQIYLLPIRPLALAFPGKPNLPYAAAWIILISFLLFNTKDSDRFLVISSLFFILYVIITVVSGYGFLPRYSSVLTPFYIIISAVALVTSARLLRNITGRLRGVAGVL
jgi:hypothetical protein